MPPIININILSFFVSKHHPELTAVYLRIPTWTARWWQLRTNIRIIDEVLPIIPIPFLPQTAQISKADHFYEIIFWSSDATVLILEYCKILMQDNKKILPRLFIQCISLPTYIFDVEKLQGFNPPPPKKIPFSKLKKMLYLFSEEKEGRK